jgi:putative ABC transport system ATP-binding protein
MSDYVVLIEKINKVYQLGSLAVPVLIDINLSIRKKDFVAIMGPSGSGKSSLLNLIGCLDRPTTGKIFIDDTDTSILSDDELAKIRGKKIGFVFQSFNLIARLNAIRNVEIPMIFQEIPKLERMERAKILLNDVGLQDRMLHKPTELSGGERQRVSIARALANEPSLILADEPTGNLDMKSGDQVMEIFKNLHRQGRTIIMVTHDPKIAECADRIIRIVDKRIQSTGIN